MKAAIYEKYGPPEVLHVVDLPKPEIQANQVLVHVEATTVNSGDRHMRKADPFIVRFFAGLFAPKQKILGSSYAGVVEAVGDDVTQFKVADKVFGSTGVHLGSYAEFIAVAGDGMIQKIPEGVSFHDAAAAPFGGLAALHFLKQAKMTPGMNVLVYGASGAVGIAAVQVAKYFGATVTGVCSGSNEEVVRSVGADEVLDYRGEDFSLPEDAYDVIIETVGKSSYSKVAKALKEKGILLQVTVNFGHMLKGLLTSLTTKKKVISGIVESSTDDLALLAKLMEEGKFVSVIDKVYPLEEVADAHRHVEAGHKKGNVVMSM